MKSISKDEFKSMMKEGNLVVVNVLSQGAYMEDHIEGSINIPVGGEFEDTVKKVLPDKSEKVVVYCASFECQASSKASQILDDLGYENVLDYEGGMKDWRA